MQKRHENIMSQLKRELRLEGEKEKRKMLEAQKAYNQIHAILLAVRQARMKQKESEQAVFEKMAYKLPKHSELYDQMRATLYDTQRSVEALCGTWCRRLMS